MGCKARVGQYVRLFGPTVGGFAIACYDCGAGLFDRKHCCKVGADILNKPLIVFWIWGTCCEASFNWSLGDVLERMLMKERGEVRVCDRAKRNVGSDLVLRIHSEVEDDAWRFILPLQFLPPQNLLKDTASRLRNEIQPSFDFCKTSSLSSRIPRARQKAASPGSLERGMKTL